MWKHNFQLTSTQTKLVEELVQSLENYSFCFSMEEFPGLIKNLIQVFYQTKLKKLKSDISGVESEVRTLEDDLEDAKSRLEELENELKSAQHDLSLLVK